MKCPKKSDLIEVYTSRGTVQVTRDDLGSVIDALASRMSEGMEVGSISPENNDDVDDARLLLRINPDYADLGLNSILDVAAEDEAALMPKFKFTVDRAKWFRGQGSKESKLRRNAPDGKMCCVGFLAKACGVPTDDIVGVAAVNNQVLQGAKTPEPLSKFLTEWSGHTGWAMRVYAANDRMVNKGKRITSPQRERHLKGLFAQQGIEVKFVGRSR